MGRKVIYLIFISFLFACTSEKENEFNIYNSHSEIMINRFLYGVKLEKEIKRNIVLELDDSTIFKREMDWYIEGNSKNKFNDKNLFKKLKAKISKNTEINIERLSDFQRIKSFPELCPFNDGGSFFIYFSPIAFNKEINKGLGYCKIMYSLNCKRVCLRSFIINYKLENKEWKIENATILSRLSKDKVNLPYITDFEGYKNW